MKLSPRMIQSMEILQLPSLALDQRISQELETNPVLELEADTEEQTPAPPDEEPSQDADQPLDLVDSERNAGREDFERLASFSSQHGEEWSQNTESSAEFRRPSRDDGEADAKMDAMANTAARSASLTEQLWDQWRFVEAADRVRRAGEHLIAFIDDDGYLRSDLQEMLASAPEGVDAETLEEAARLVREWLEPVGIGARSLSECLLLQIDAAIAEGDDSETLHVARRLVTDHIPDIEANRLPKIARQTGLTHDQINAALARIRRLDPRPGRQLAPARPEAVVPDVIIDYDPVEDRYVAALNRGRQTGLAINPVYRKMTEDPNLDKETRKYLTGSMQSARWLIDSLNQRNSTLLRVVEVVIEEQRDFLDYGPDHLRPLPMIYVADRLGIHVGTVSRAVSEKWVQTPRGIFPLRRFFSGGTEGGDGDGMSWVAIQAKLKEIIDQEPDTAPYSDDQLVEALKQQGVEIARRTVAKYRKQMNIAPARRRKKFVGSET